MAILYGAAPNDAAALDGSLNQLTSIALPASNGACALQARDQANDSYVALVDGSGKQQGTGDGKVISASKVRPGKQASESKFQTACGVTNVTISTDSFLGSGTQNNDPASGVYETELSFSYTGTDGKPYFATAILRGDPVTGVSQSLSVTASGLLTSFALSSPAVSPGSADTAIFGLVFAASVQNLDASDFQTSAGTVSVTGSGARYDIRVSAIPEGSTAALSFSASQNIQDLNGVGLATPSLTVSYERQAASPTPPGPTPPGPTPPGPIQPGPIPTPTPLPVPSGTTPGSSSANGAPPPSSPTAQAANLLLGDLQGRAALSHYASRGRQRLSLGAAAGLLPHAGEATIAP